jgi:hypothetical protein
MERTYKINYNQIISMVHKLSYSDRKKLAMTIQSEVESEKTPSKLQELLLKAPVWTDGDFQDFNEARSYLNKSRIA